MVMIVIICFLLRPFPAAFSPSPQVQKCSFSSTRPRLLASSDPSLSASRRMGPSWRRSSPSWPQPTPASGGSPVRTHLARLETDLCSNCPNSIKSGPQVVPPFLGVLGRSWSLDLGATSAEGGDTSPFRLSALSSVPSASPALRHLICTALGRVGKAPSSLLCFPDEGMEVLRSDLSRCYRTQNASQSSALHVLLL